LERVDKEASSTRSATHVIKGLIGAIARLLLPAQQPRNLNSLAEALGQKPAPKPLRFGASFLERANRVKPAHDAGVNPFAVAATHPLHPPVVTASAPKMAMDEAGAAIATWAFASPFSGFGAREGFLGYPFLTELALLAEYRNIVETIATECTRRWIKLQATGDDIDKTDKITELDTELKRLAVRDHFRRICEHDGYFGRAHLYVDTGDTDKRDELTSSIGNGRDAATKSKIKKGSLKGLRSVEPVWIYPLAYNTTDPLAADWYRPTASNSHRPMSTLLCCAGKPSPARPPSSNPPARRSPRQRNPAPWR
jgi:hypothetical protein